MAMESGSSKNCTMACERAQVIKSTNLRVESTSCVSIIRVDKPRAATFRLWQDSHAFDLTTVLDYLLLSFRRLCRDCVVINVVAPGSSPQSA
jgi:hypothetical protein